MEKIKGLKKVVLIVSVVSVVLLIGLSASIGQEKELKFFHGKIIRIIVCTTPGGGFDTYARFTAPHLQRHLPGSRVVVENVPGAGQLIGTNKVYESPPDGLTLGIINRGMIFNQLIGTKGIRFDLGKFNWLANLAAEPRFFVVGKKSKFQTLEQITKGGPEIKIGCTGAGTVAYNDTVMLKEIMDWPVRVVSGYGGSSDSQLATIKGEVDAMVGIYDTLRISMESGDIKPLLQMGGRKIPGMESVRLLREIIPPGNEDLMNLLEIQYSVSRLLAAPPGLPVARRDLLREIYKKMVEDKEFINAAKKINLNIEFTSGEELESMMRGALKQPPKVIDLLKRVIVIGG